MKAVTARPTLYRYTYILLIPVLALLALLIASRLVSLGSHMGKTLISGIIRDPATPPQ
jgi:hypothetical protein